MSLVERLLGITALGTEWILIILLLASVVSIALMLERIIFYSRIKINFSEFSKKLTKFLGDKDIDGALKFCEESPSMEAQVAYRGLANKPKGVAAMEGSMDGFIIGERQKLDRGLVVLGTLGNNAPFIGLFGTVIGIITAFNDLANNPDGGPSVVMSGISEALVATAVGLMVAIPAVIAFNAFNRVVKRRVANSQATAKLVLTYFE